jgi:hypothetical protein
VQLAKDKPQTIGVKKGGRYVIEPGRDGELRLAVAAEQP